MVSLSRLTSSRPVRYGATALWFGFLAYPFTDRLTAAAIALITGTMLAGWWAFRTEGARRLFSRAMARLSGLRTFTPAATAFLGTWWFRAAFILFLIVLPLFVNNYYRDIMTLTGMYVVLALGLNLVVGQAGLLHLGYVAFYAVGAYTYAILSTTLGLPFWPGLLVSALASSLFAFLLGLPTLRLRGDYFAIVTLGLGEITRIVLNNWDSLTNGPNGIGSIGRPAIGSFVFSSPIDFYYLILAFAILTVAAMYRLISSRIGRAWMAIREDEVAAAAMGINTFRLKMLAFVIGSAWAGVVGAFFAAKMAFVSPESFTFFESVIILCMVVLGGMGSIPGIILGAVLLISLPEIFRGFADYRMLAFGMAMVGMMVFRPQGLLGKGHTK